MPDIFEALRGISTSLFEQNLFSTWMLEEKSSGEQRCKKGTRVPLPVCFHFFCSSWMPQTSIIKKIFQRFNCLTSPSGIYRERCVLHSLKNTFHNKNPSKEANPQCTQGAQLCPPQQSYPFCDSIMDLGKKITQMKEYPHVVLHGLCCTNQAPLLAEEPLLHDFRKNCPEAS